MTKVICKDCGKPAYTAKTQCPDCMICQYCGGELEKKKVFVIGEGKTLKERLEYLNLMKSTKKKKDI